MRAILLVTTLLALGAAPPKQAYSPEQKEMSRELGKLNGEALGLWKRGKRDEALAARKRALAVSMELHGPHAKTTISWLAGVATYARAMGRHAEAMRMMRAEAEAWEALRGKGWWRAVDLRDDLELNERKLTPRQRQRLAESMRANAEAARLSFAGDFESALPLLERLLPALEEALGKGHRTCAEVLANLGNVHRGLGRYKEALAFHERAAALRKKVLGPLHPSCARSLGLIGLLRADLGEGATALLRRAVALLEAATNEKDARLSDALIDLSGCLAKTARFREAVATAERALAASRAGRGDKHPDCARAWDALERAQASWGDFRAAEAAHRQAVALAELPLARRAREESEKAVGKRHPAHADLLLHFASLRMELGDAAEALALMKESAEATKAALGGKHPRYGWCLNSQGGRADHDEGPRRGGAAVRLRRRDPRCRLGRGVFRSDQAAAQSRLLPRLARMGTNPVQVGACPNTAQSHICLNLHRLW
ncbi:MAG: tetratricopeptide repeat protein [Gemmataceae bacterium]|nr:tetratricopeptide repeat protein [Gemmataceae bacterium]